MSNRRIRRKRAKAPWVRRADLAAGIPIDHGAEIGDTAITDDAIEELGARGDAAPEEERSASGEGLDP